MAALPAIACTDSLVRAVPSPCPRGGQKRGPRAEFTSPGAAFTKFARADLSSDKERRKQPYAQVFAPGQAREEIIDLPAPELAERPPATARPLEFSGVFKGRELTRKDRRLSSGLLPLDNLLAGGIARGRISEIIGPASSGKTALAALYAASATRRGEVVAWIDAAGAFDPMSIEGAGADLSRILWVGFDRAKDAPSAACACEFGLSDPPRAHGIKARRRDPLRAAELVLGAGGFGLVVIDFGTMRYPLAQAMALRLARGAESSGAAALALAANPVCGTFTALTLSLVRRRACFNRLKPDAPALFDGFRIEARVARNKLGPAGHRAEFSVLADPSPTKERSEGEASALANDSRHTRSGAALQRARR